MRYFDHDTTACSDSKFLALRLEHGSVAIDLYWTLLERMYADEKALNLGGSNLETKSVLHLVSITQEELEKYVSTMIELGLFEGGLNNLFSQRAMDNIATYQQRVEAARQNGKLGGRKPKAKTEKKPSRLSDVNQSAKLRKEKKGIETYSVSNPVTLDGAVTDKPAPSSAEEVFDWVDEHVPESSWAKQAMQETMEQRERMTEMESLATPCPAGLNPFAKESA